MLLLLFETLGKLFNCLSAFNFPILEALIVSVMEILFSLNLLLFLKMFIMTGRTSKCDNYGSAFLLDCLGLSILWVL